MLYGQTPYATATCACSTQSTSRMRQPRETADDTNHCTAPSLMPLLQHLAARPRPPPVFTEGPPAEDVAGAGDIMQDPVPLLNLA